jgi:excinuclease ABC subunit A
MGGRLVFAGTPEDCAACRESFTGQFLRPVLEQAANDRHSALN